MSEVLSVKHLTCLFGQGTPYETVALDDISFSVKKGEIIGIVGQTGSGKSTLIQHLNGLIRCEEGHIFYQNEDIWAKPKEIRNIRSEIGLVFQYPEYQLFEETVYRDIAFGPKNMGLSESEIDARVRLACEMVGLKAEQFDDSPFDFSGGQKRRIAIAGVLAMQPSVLILDEPSAGLDPKGRKQIFDLIENYRKRLCATVIIVSHNMEDIAAVADRLLVMHRGKVVKYDTPKAVFSSEREAKDFSLELPEAARLAEKMRQSGIAVEEGILTSEELTLSLIRLWKGGGYE